MHMLAGCGPLISLDLLEPKGLGLDWPSEP